MTPDERKVLEALEYPEWDARTIAGLARSTGLPEIEVLRIVQNYPQLVDAYSSTNHGIVVQLRNRAYPAGTNLFDKALDYLSLGKRRRIA